MEIEATNNINLPEQEKKSLFDAVLVHGYWLSQRRDGSEKLGLRSHLAARAAALFFDKGQGVQNIVITVGKIWGPRHESEGRIIADELIKNYHVPKESIILRDVAMTTKDEIDEFLQLAKERKWTRLVDIATRTHQRWTIPLLYKKRSQAVMLKSVEDVIKEKDDRRIKDLISRFGRSRYEWSFIIYEGIKRLTLLIDPDYRFLGTTANMTRKEKGESVPGLLGKVLKIDKYKL